MKNLKNLLDGSKLKSDIQFKKLCINSNDIDPGDIFVALKNSSKRDGNKCSLKLITFISNIWLTDASIPSLNLVLENLCRQL